MRVVQIRLGSRSYPIVIEAGSLSRLGEYSREYVGESTRTAVLITNPTVDRLYGKQAGQSLRRARFNVERYLIGEGEQFKTLKTAQSLFGLLIRRGVERGDLIIALGGGVVGDLAGFVAGTYQRGVRFINVPTTLLAQIDSSVGGKTGVNHPLGKNMIGLFHQPTLVLIDQQTLVSLPKREIRAGLCEAIKYGVIRDPKLFRRIITDIELLKRADPEANSYLIRRCCEIKAEVVSKDERETGLRRILNFGHTVGHALESITRYRRFLHGEAVGHGMRAASRIAELVGLLGTEERQAIGDAVSEVGRLPRTDDLAVSDIMDAMRRDKKATAGRIVMVLPERIGSVIVRSDVPSRVISRALKDALSCATA